MTRTESWTRVLAVVAASAVALAGATSAHAQTALTAAQIEQLAHGLQSKGFKQLGSRFGCVTTPGSNAGSPTIRFAVTTPAAREQATELIAALGAQDVARVTVVQSRYGDTRRNKLMALLNRRIRAHHWRNVWLTVGGMDLATRCPRVFVTAGPQASDAQRTWVALQERRYWDRVQAAYLSPDTITAH
jgi:hypothetical protein